MKDLQVKSLGKITDVSCFWEIWMVVKFGEKKETSENQVAES